MAEKFLLVGIGYMLGARAGRARFDELMDMGKTLWKRDEVQMAVNLVAGLLEDRFTALAGDARLAA